MEEEKIDKQKRVAQKPKLYNEFEEQIQAYIDDEIEKEQKNRKNTKVLGYTIDI